jgi:alcohol dehydrogenase
LITDPDTHQKMACGDTRALPKLAVLDSDLTATAPAKVAAATGIDAIAHSVETAGCNKRNDTSRKLSRMAWEMLEPAYERVVFDPKNREARRAMLMGAHIAGAAIENSMLSAAHSCANALTAKFETVHGVAVGLMLPHVIRFNAGAGENPYSDLEPDAAVLAKRIERMLKSAQIPRTITEVGATKADIDALASIAAEQWTAKFNPRPVGKDDFAAIFSQAL